MYGGAEGRGQKAEGRRQRAEGRGQRAEGRGQRAEGSRQRAEGRGQQAKGRGQRAQYRKHALRAVTLSSQAVGIRQQTATAALNHQDSTHLCNMAFRRCLQKLLVLPSPIDDIDSADNGSHILLVQLHACGICEEVLMH